MKEQRQTKGRLIHWSLKKETSFCVFCSIFVSNEKEGYLELLKYHDTQEDRAIY